MDRESLIKEAETIYRSLDVILDGKSMTSCSMAMIICLADICLHMGKKGEKECQDYLQDIIKDLTNMVNNPNKWGMSSENKDQGNT